jgi:hypothetical protein
MRCAIAVVFAAVLFVGCQGQPPTQAAYTGGGGIGSHQDHKDTSERSATDSGQSAGAGTLGQVFGSGTQAPGNADSPTESNGGTGGSPKAYPLAIAQGKATANEQSTHPSSRH